MDVPAFSQIERQLRVFLRHVCIDLSNGDLRCLEGLRPARSTFDELQLSEYCRLLVMNADGLRDLGDSCLLFGRIRVNKTLPGEISFVRALRNKYAHISGDRIIHSKEQLADMLVVERMVGTLDSLCSEDHSKPLIHAKIDELVKELLDNVVRSSMPQQFDIEDIQLTAEVDLGIRADTTAPGVVSTETTGFPDNAIDLPVTSLQDKLAKIEEKLASLPDIVEGLKRIEEVVVETRSRDNAPSATDSTVVSADALEGEDDPDLPRRTNNPQAESRLKEFDSEVCFAGADDDDTDQVDEDDQFSFSEALEDDHLEHKLEDIKRMVDVLNANMRRLTQPIDFEEARDELITLRKRIWRETGTGPSADGILRTKMIDLFLQRLPSTEEDALESDLGWYIERCDERQRVYLDDICSITSRVVN